MSGKYQNTSEQKANKKDSPGVKKQKQQLLEAMAKHYCVVAPACREVGCSRTTYYDYYNNDEEFKKAIDDMAELDLDLAEEKLHKAIDDENITAIIFKLKTKGKKRGYVERFEVKDKTNQDEDLDQLTNEELLELLEKEAAELRQLIKDGK